MLFLYCHNWNDVVETEIGILITGSRLCYTRVDHRGLSQMPGLFQSIYLAKKNKDTKYNTKQDEISVKREKKNDGERQC